MATYTEHYNLVKPEDTDIYDVADFNENMDTIDSIMAEAEQGMESISEKIGTSAEGNTLFSLLEGGAKSGLTAIKSIHHITQTLANNSTSASIPLETSVIPKNCIMWVEILSTSRLNQFYYTLNESSLSLSYSNVSGNYTYIYDFWIIELM